MRFIKGNFKRLSKILLCISILAIATGLVAAAATDPGTTVWDDPTTVVSAKAGENHYVVHGVHYLYNTNNTNYTPYYTGTDLYLRIESLSRMMGVSTDEFAAKSIKPYNTGKMDLYSVKETAKVFGKDVISQNGLFVIVDNAAALSAEQKATCLGLSLRYYGEELFSVNFDNVSVASEQSVLGGNADYFYGESGKSYCFKNVGDNTNYYPGLIPYDSKLQIVKISFWAMATEDMAGMKPIAWIYRWGVNDNGGNHFLGREAAVLTNDAQISSEKWTYFEYEIATSILSPNVIGEKEVKKLGFYIGTSKDGSNSDFAGMILVDDLQITKYKAITANYNAPGYEDDEDDVYQYGKDVVKYYFDDLSDLDGAEAVLVSIYKDDKLMTKKLEQVSDIKKNGYLTWKPTVGGHITMKLSAQCFDGSLRPLSKVYTSRIGFEIIPNDSTMRYDLYVKKYFPETDWKYADTVISIQAGQPYYHRFGEKVYFDPQNIYYRPFYTGFDLMAPANAVANILGVSVKYDATEKTYTFSGNGTTAVLGMGVKTMQVNGEEVWLSNKPTNPGDMDLLPLGEITKAFGRGFIVDEGVFVITHSQEIAEWLQREDNSEKYRTLMGQAARLQDKLICEQKFDGLTTAPVYDSSTTATKKVISTNGAFQGDSYAMSVVTESGKWSVATLPKIPLDETARSYKVTFWAKVSPDFKGNNVYVHVWCYKDGKFVHRKVLRDTGHAVLGTEWTYFEWTLDTYSNMSNASNGAITFDAMNESFADEFYFSVGLFPDGTNDAQGTLYLDNIQLLEGDLVSMNVHASFVADKTGAWYHPGDTITYKMPDPTQLNGYRNLCATIFDVDGNIVKTYTDLSVKDIQKRGLTIETDDLRPGYYEMDMTVQSADGTVYSVAELYSRVWRLDNDKPIEIATHEILTRTFVIAEESKSAEETNDLFMLSTSGSETELLLGREVGYSGVRLHYITWGSTYSSKGFHTASGTFDWTRADSQIFGAKNAGYDNIIANIFSTPKWAAPVESWSMEGMSIGNYYYNRYAPADLDNLKAGMTAFVNRYGDSIMGIEFWNEPMYGKSAFWVDTVDNFRAMSNAAAEAIKEANPDVKFISAGFTHASNAFLTELIAPKTPGLEEAGKTYLESLDGFSYHGFYGKYDNFETTLETYGLKDILQIDSESYLYAHKETNGTRDWRVNNMLYLSAMMYKIRDDLDMVAHFSLLDGNVNDHAEMGYSTTSVYGLFSQFPYIQPHQGAFVQHFFMQQVGKEFTYVGEYDLGDGQKAVLFNNDGEPFVVFWNSESSVKDLNDNLIHVDKTFAISDKLRACFTENTTIIDYLNMPADADALKTMKMYYIKGLDATKLADLESSEGAVLSSDFERPFYNCITEPREGNVEISNLNNIPHYNNPTGKLFDEKADVWTLNEGFELIATDWNWQATVPLEKKPAGFNAAQLAYIDEDGFYLVMDVDDEEHSCTRLEDDPSAYWNNDSIQLTIDTVGRNNNEDDIELTICYLNGKVQVYKQAAPTVDAMLPDDYTDPGNLMPSEYCQVTKTEKGYRYMLFVPMAEMFPYVFPGTTDYVRVAFLANQNNGKERTGYLEWASGIGGIKDVNQYGAILFESYGSKSAGVSWDVICGNNTAQDQVTTDLILPSTTKNGQDIIWTSSDETVITTLGKVMRQDTDKQVTLTATWMNNGEEKKMVFELTVLAGTSENNANGSETPGKSISPWWFVGGGIVAVLIVVCIIFRKKLVAVFRKPK